MHKITFSKNADKALRRMPRSIALNNGKKVKELANNPNGMRNVKKLNDHPGYRLRVGDWRIIYIVNENELLIHIINIKTRGEVYR